MSRTRHRPRAALAIALVVVVANAALQALFVALAPRDALDAGAIALATLSGIALTAASAALWAILAGAHSRRRSALVCASAVLVVALAIAAPPLIPLGVALACPVIAAGGVRAAARSARAHPWRVLGLLAVTVIAVVLGTVLAMLLGLLVAGVLAAAITWFCVGLGGAALTIAWLRTCAPSHAVAQP